VPDEPRFVPLAFERLSKDAQRARSRTFLDEMSRRRSVRSFSSEPVSYELVKESVGIAPGCTVADLVPSRPTRSSSCAYLVYVWTVGSGSRRSSRSSKSRRMLSPLESTAS